VHIEDNLISLNSRGIFPGPSEQEEEFFKRANTAAAKKGIVQKNLKLTQEIFEACPDWVKIHFAQKGLLPWEGAATWIEKNPEGIREASVQIKTSFVARLYPQEEMIAHEMVHAMRLAFEERRFEEILAFRTSKNRFRRYFGPLFTQPGETKGFVMSMLAVWLFNGAEWIFDFSLGAKYLLWFPLMILGWGCLRLARSQKIFSLALNHLEKAVKAPKLAIALRLSDREIELFAKSSPEEILAFVSKEKEKSLRWRQLFSAYFLRDVL
jgi:hypothetical protein